MRCEEFYEKWQKAGNFCEKHPDTAARIESFLDLMIAELAPEIAKSEILNTENTPMGTILTERSSRPLISEKDPETRQEAIKQIVKVAEEKAMDGVKPQVTENEVRQILDGCNKTAHVSYNSGDNEWYTPKEIIEAARNVMGEIDLDPASSEEANTIVKAVQYFNEQENGLLYSWRGRIFMNPPYASNLIGDFIKKLVDEINEGNVNEAIILVNNATETRWFQSIARICSAVCFPMGRIKFWHPRKEAVPLQGQAILYAGKNIGKFLIEFKEMGIIWTRSVE
jgi:ParB family transcriptional regulator, chromosome partitioning protein